MWIVLVSMALLFSFGAIWLGGWFLGASLALKIGLSIVVVAFAMLAWLAVLLVRRQRAVQLERGLAEQGAQQLAGAGADRRDQLRALQDQVQRAIAALKRSRLGGKGGAAALYALPWYVIVGPPGAGKTTAIRHSGLSFPLDQSASYRGSGGTRNCDWWFTNDAILLDTAGRYSTNPGDQSEWLGFLGLLRKHRKRKPINGLLVALSIQDLAAGSAEHVDAIAKQMRARVDEVTRHLKLLVPVYVVFTKVDLIAGFSECWSDLRKSERGQLWGATFPTNSSGAPREEFEREFELLVQALHRRALRRMTSERSTDVRRAIVHFPTEVAALKENLATFVSALFQKNAYQETPALRGFYFTSGTQTVKPSARVASSLGAAMGLRGGSVASTGAADSAIESKSYFLTDLFHKVIFPDQKLAGHTEGEKRRQLLVRSAFAGLAILIASSLLLPAGCTFVRNRELIGKTAEVGRALETVPWDELALAPEAVAALAPADAQLRQLEAWNSNTPVQLGWGLYTGSRLFEGLRDAYVTAVSRVMLAKTRADLEDRLRAFESSPVRTSENFNRDFDALKLYLMLGDPSHMDAGWAAPRLVRQWEIMPHPHVPGEGEALAPHVLYVCDLLARGEVRPWQPDAALVSRARSILSQVPQVDRLYESLVRDANAEIAPIRREGIFYGSIGPFVKSRNGVKVAGAYSKQGWARVRVLLGTEGDKLTQERWVLGEEPAQIGQAMGKLRDLYFERFKNAWRDFIGDLEIADPGNAEYALAELNAISEPEWPYLRLLRVLSDNVTLEVDAPETSLLDQAKEKAQDALDGGSLLAAKRTLSPVERAFKPMLRFGVPPESKDGEPPMTGLAQWEGLVAKLIGVLTDVRDGAANSDPKATSDAFQEAFRATSALLSEQDGFTRPLLSPLLMQPITLAWSNVVKDAGMAAGASWEVSVWQKWHDKLEGRYPFAPAKSDAALEDFVRFFAPGQGDLWAFYDASLKATLDRNGNSFVPSRRFRSSIGYTGPFLDVCLKRGAEITDVLYPPKSEQAMVSFDVNLHSVSSNIVEVIFEVDGVSHTYKNEPEQWIRVQWPGKTAHGARLRVRGAQGLNEELARPGDFGLFRLLDAADVVPGKAAGKSEGAPTLVATWDLRAAREALVKLDLRPVRNEHPLLTGYFKGYNCPKSITGSP